MTNAGWMFVGFIYGFLMCSMIYMIWSMIKGTNPGAMRGLTESQSTEHRAAFMAGFNAGIDSPAVVTKEMIEAWWQEYAVSGKQQ